MQRLYIARAIANRPEILLMDEPAPRSIVPPLKMRDKELATKSQELASNITTRMSFELSDGVARYLELIFILR